MPVLQPPLNRLLGKSRNLLERSTAHRGGYLPEGFEEGTIAGGRRDKSLVRSLLRIFAGGHVRCGGDSQPGRSSSKSGHVRLASVATKFGGAAKCRDVPNPEELRVSKSRPRWLLAV